MSSYIDAAEYYIQYIMEGERNLAEWQRGGKKREHSVTWRRLTKSWEQGESRSEIKMTHHRELNGELREEKPDICCNWMSCWSESETERDIGLLTQWQASSGLTDRHVHVLTHRCPIVLTNDHRVGLLQGRQGFDTWGLLYFKESFH